MNYNIKISNLEDDWIVGFVDGDGCFSIAKDKTFSFVVSQDKDSVSTLYALKTAFKCGTVNKTSKNMMEYRVKAKEQLKDIIIPFFVKNSLQTKKIDSFAKFHYAVTGNVYNLPPERPLTREWLVGFTDAEGCFTKTITPETDAQPNKIQLKLTIGQNEKGILDRICQFMGYGSVLAKDRDGKKYALQIGNIEGHLRVITLFTTGLNRCLLKTTKRIDFLSYKSCAFYMRDGKHLSIEGKKHIRALIEKKKNVQKKARREERRNTEPA
jgi:hypothetical protein